MLRLACLLLAFAVPAAASETLPVCFDYGCARQAAVALDDVRLEALRDWLAVATDAVAEREAIGQAVAAMYRWAAEQTPIGADRGGNFADAGVEGRMDCIDHSTTADAMLQLLDRHGWLHYHHAGGRVLRRRFIVVEHWSAWVEETSGGRFVVDAWFAGASRPPLVMPLDEWLDGGGEIVE
jgi:hypothetical protein